MADGLSGLPNAVLCELDPAADWGAVAGLGSLDGPSAMKQHLVGHSILLAFMPPHQLLAGWLS